MASLAGLAGERSDQTQLGRGPALVRSLSNSGVAVVERRSRCSAPLRSLTAGREVDSAGSTRGFQAGDVLATQDATLLLGGAAPDA